MSHGVRQRQPLRCRLLASHDDVDPVVGPQAVVCHPEEAVGIRREVDADDVRLLVDDQVDKAGILVGEPVVILSPHVGRQKVVERSYRVAPTQIARHFQPLGVLVEHRVHDVDKSLVA